MGKCAAPDSALALAGVTIQVSPLTRQELAERVAFLAARGDYGGMSSWKYPGWCGMLYDRSRYEYRAKFAESRFKRDCLAEYAEVFTTVCVDAAYYTFPSQQYLESIVIRGVHKPPCPTQPAP